MAGSTATGLARRGVDCISRGDRVHYSQCADRIDSLSWVNKPSLRAHEDGVMSFMSHFLARGEARVRRKLRGYGSADWGDGCPVLIVCWNDDAEFVFQRLVLLCYMRFKDRLSFGWRLQ